MRRLQKLVFRGFKIPEIAVSTTVFRHVSEKCQLYRFHVKARKSITTDFRKKHEEQRNWIRKTIKIATVLNYHGPYSSFLPLAEHWSIGLNTRLHSQG